MVRRYRDPYGRCAVAIGSEHRGWKLTILNGTKSYTRTARSEAKVRTILNAVMPMWSEVG